MKIINCEQGTPEWFEERKGIMTASHAQAIGNAGKGLDTYIHELMAEYYSSGEKEQFSNKHTERGNELEPLARQVYELENGVDVQTVGFIKEGEYTGCSPDGLVGEDGGTEIKCPDDVEYLKYLLGERDAIDSKYIWQVQMNLLLTKREWWDLIIYNPNFKRSMMIFKIVPDPEMFAKLENGFKVGEAKIKEIKNIIENK